MRRFRLRRSYSCGGRRPRLVSLCPELAEGRAADQVTLDGEDIVDGGVGGEEPLGRTLGLELLLFALASPDRQMCVFRPIIPPQSAGPMAILAAEFSGRDAVGSQPSVTIMAGCTPWRFSSFRSNFSAEALLRRIWTSMSRSSPSSSTARHRDMVWPPIVTISSRCQRTVGLGLDRRRLLAKSRPSFKVQQRMTVSLRLANESISLFDNNEIASVSVIRPMSVPRKRNPWNRAGCDTKVATFWANKDS